jgi:uncharacterized protein (TIRG00374 family)
VKKLHAILLALGFGFLSYLVWTIGGGALWRELSSLGWGLVPLLLGEGVAEMIHTVGWRHCLNEPLRSLPWSRLFRIRMAGYAINYLTPTAAVGGEVTKAALLAQERHGADAVSGVLVGKVAFALAHLVFVVLGSALVLWRIKLPSGIWLAMVVCSTLVAGGIVAFLLIQKHGKFGAILRRLAARKLGGEVVGKAAGAITEVDKAMQRFYSERPLDLAIAVCWHLLGYSVGIGQTWLFFRLLGAEPSFFVAAGAWFLGMWFDLLTFAVPLNLGTLEGTRIVVFNAIGYNALMGMTYGIALRLAQMTWASVGLLFYVALMSRAGGPIGDAHPDTSQGLKGLADEPRV